ncbi:MAG: response regulator transcription factor [Acidobacteria bacterium]|nr:response regulator transcription factor [Acidobacteriota bacterium]MBV9069548.1 response regulator transcription factor [Acidobacteriota bacterium]MBV9186004.1 response regulator transcription factor [Acidobacteriota bacterium]
MSNVILIVDDDPAIRDSLSKELRAAGYSTTTAADGSEGMAAFQSRVPDLVLTDLAMPRSDGFELIAAIRASSRVPIVVLSVRGADPDKVRALDLGADDFVTKPFSMTELLARVRAQLRRTAPASTALAFQDLTIELDRRRVVQGGREVRLTPTEFSLLEVLAANAGKPMFIEQIIARVWRSAPSTSADTVRVHMSSLRKKIEPNPSEPQYIVTEPWVGYRFIAEPV